MKFEGIIGILMVLLAIVALIVWETGAGRGYSMPDLWASGAHEADEALGGHDMDAGSLGAVSLEAVQFWASQGDFTGDLAYNATPWGPPTWH